MRCVRRPQVIHCRLKQAEATDAIKLSTLRRVAEALDCDLQYALGPRRSLWD